MSNPSIKMSNPSIKMSNYQNNSRGKPQDYTLIDLIEGITNK